MKTLLVIVYLSHTGALDMKSHMMNSMAECKAAGQQIHKNVKAGRVNTVCWGIK